MFIVQAFLRILDNLLNHFIRSEPGNPQLGEVLGEHARAPVGDDALRVRLISSHVFLPARVVFPDQNIPEHCRFR